MQRETKYVQSYERFKQTNNNKINKLSQNMSTVIVKLKYAPITNFNGRPCTTVDKAILLYVDADLNTVKTEIDYMSSSLPLTSTLRSRACEVADGEDYIFKNIEFEQINRKLLDALKSVKTILHKGEIEKQFLRHFVLDNEENGEEVIVKFVKVE